MKLPIFASAMQELTALQTRWASIIEPFLSKEQNDSFILENIKLASGSNTVNHLLGHKLKGWTIVRQNASATFYDAQSTNKTPELTLVLFASAGVTVSIEVF